MLQARDARTTPEQYLERCGLKTGMLFATACALGGRLGGVPVVRAAACCARYGHDLGLAFQIADDVLDCAGSLESTGKPIGTDLLDGTATLPLLLRRARRRGGRRARSASGPAPGRGARAPGPRRRDGRDHRGPRRRPRLRTPRRGRARRPRRTSRHPSAPRASCAAWSTGRHEVWPSPHAATRSSWRSATRSSRASASTSTTASRCSSATTCWRSASSPTPRAALRGGYGRGLLRQQPVPEPHDDLPGEVQVLRLRAHVEAARCARCGRSRTSSRSR